MFELRRDVPDDEIVAGARSARAAGRVCFQVFAPHTGARSEEEADYEAARLVDLLEAEQWALENAAYAAEPGDRHPGAYGFLAAPAVVGTIYTFRLSEGS
jgi:hypothetical protein